MTEQALADLGQKWRKAKQAEAAANKARVAIESQIIAITGCKEEGSQTHDAGPFKITVTGKLNRTLDRALWNEIERTIPKAKRPVEYVPRLDTKGLRYLENYEPELFRTIAQAITTKPGKPAISIKE